MSFLRYHRNSDLKLLNPKNDFTVWDEYTLHKAVAPEVSLQFSWEDVSFLNISLRVSINIPSQFPQRQSFRTGWLSVSFSTVKWSYTSESGFLEPFFLGFISGYFNFHHSLQYATKYLFFTFIEIVFKHCLVRKEVCPQCPFANLSMMQFQNCVI